MKEEPTYNLQIFKFLIKSESALILPLTVHIYQCYRAGEKVNFCLTPCHLAAKIGTVPLYTYIYIVIVLCLDLASSWVQFWP